MESFSSELAHAQRHIAFRLAQQPVADHAAGHLVAFGAGERGIVDAEDHGKRRRIDRLRRQRRLDVRRADRVRHGGVRQASHRDDVAGFRLVHAGAFKPAEGEQLGDAAGLDQPAIAVEHLDGLVDLDAAGKDAAGDDTAEIGIGLEDGAEHAERPLFHGGRLHVSEHEIEQRRHRFLRSFQILRHPAFLGRTVEDREIKLFVGRVERGKQIEHLVDHLRRARVGAIDLVDGDDGLEPHLERLRHHELGLRQRALGSVDQNDGAIHHVEDALHLAAEIGVAGRVDDIDARALPDD